MSIHLHTVSLDMDRVNRAISIQDLNKNSVGVDFKVQTPMTDRNVMESILQDKLLGFKNKRELTNFRDLGEMIFYKEFNDDRISIIFFGNYPKNETIMFVNNLNYEYLKKTNRLDLYEEIPYDVDFKEKQVKEAKKQVVKKEAKKEVKKEQIRTLRIPTAMKNKSVINSIMNTSYLGYNTQAEIDEFKNKGQIIFNKAENDCYDIIFMGDYENKEVEAFIKNLTDEYANKIQEITYEKVLEKIREKNYSLESELIDTNDSIVLTLNLN